jgi:hypothetical protein
MDSKIEERESLFTLLESRPEWQVESVKDFEEPDFLIRMGGKTVGVEVTKFSPASGNTAHQQHGLRRRTLRGADTCYLALGGPPMQVHVTFSPGYPLTSIRSNQVAEYLATFVNACHRKLVFGYQSSTFTRDLYDDGFPREVDWIRAVPAGSGNESSWSDQQPIWYVHAGAEAVSQIVRRKESRVDSYLAKCDEVWLLIDFPWLGADVDTKIPVDGLELQTSTRFAHVFCVDTLRGRVTEMLHGSATLSARPTE